MTTHAERTQDYAYGVPVPPRIVIPPPQYGDNTFDRLELNLTSGLTAEQAQMHKYQHPPNTNESWSYNKRREAQLILPYLLLGPMTVTKDPSFLKNNDVTLAIGVRLTNSKVLDSALARCRESGVETHSFEVGDQNGLTALYQYTSRLIASHLTSTLQADGSFGKVFVFCESGNEKSAAIAAAFIMAAHNDCDHIKAMQLCQLQRFCCNFDETVKHSLQSYWDILAAERMQVTSTPGRQKRRFERADSTDDDGDADDMQRFADRANIPFVDHS